MKKLLILALAALLLCGCTAEPPAPTEPSVPETPPATEEIVIPHESLELLEFDYENVYAAAPMGDDLLLLSGMDSTTLIKISGRNHKELASIAAGVSINPGTSTLRISESGVCYAAEKEYIFLDENLEEIQRITLPDAWGRGAVTADQQNIYYSTGSELWVYNRQTGLHRLLRETMHTGLALESLELNDSVLICTLLDHSAVSPTLFYSTATGELLATYEHDISLKSAGELWLADISDNYRDQTVFGTGSEKAHVLTVYWEKILPVSDGILMQTQEESTVTFRFLDLKDTTSAVLKLDGNGYMTNAWRVDDLLWISLNDGRLLRWELDAYEAQDAAACIAPYFSRENPDTEGLAALESTILEMEDYYSVEIHIAEDAVAAQPDGITLHSEYQVDALTEGLKELELALIRFTPEFLTKVGKASDDGKVHISLVRAVNSEGCIQFWDDGAAYIALEVNDDLQRNFFHGLAHIIDAKVLTECTAFDSWKSLNPSGFSYLYDYTAEADSSAFPGTFADYLGMVSPLEDRASVFTYAMLADSEGVFESDTMQRKLSTLCNGIRKAFGMKDSEETFPWEQYLAE